MSGPRAVPPVEQVAPGVWSFPVPIRSVRHLPYSLVYGVVAADDRVHLIDAGFDEEGSFEHLQAALAEAGRDIDAIASVTLTHRHLDHSGLALRIRASTGARIQVHELDAVGPGSTPAPTAADLEAWGVPRERWAELRESRPASAPLEPDRMLVDGDVLDVPGRTMEVMHTPGHSAGHICIGMPAEGLLFVGDHILPQQFPGLGLGGSTGRNPVADYLRSLDRVARYGAPRGLPGHGRPVEQLGDRIARLRQHVEDRAGELARIRSTMPAGSIWELASRIRWSAGWEALRGHYLASALRQTHLYDGFVRAGETA